MQKRAIVFTVIMALVLMGCPPPVSDTPTAPASEVNDSAQNGDKPNVPAAEVNNSAQNGDKPNVPASGSNNPNAPLPGGDNSGDLASGGNAPVQSGDNSGDLASGGNAPAQSANNPDDLVSEVNNPAQSDNNPDDLAPEVNNPAQSDNNPDDLAPEVQDIVLPKVSTGKQYTMIITPDDSLWAAGLNNKGQLGDDSTTNRVTPKKIMDEVAQVSAGTSHTMIITPDDSLWAAGLNNKGQLGDGTTNERSTLAPVKNAAGEPMTEVAQVSAGTTHTMILKKNETLWGVGDNYDGGLGNDESDNEKHLPVQVKQTNPDGSDSPVPMTTVASVSAGYDYTMILKKNDTLWAVGSNAHGQLGINANTSKSVAVRIMDEVASVSASTSHVMILKKNDTLWAVGSNEHGKLGNGESGNEKHLPVQVKQPNPGGSGPPIPMTEVAYVSAGKYHSMIVKKNGELWAVGRNDSGQLGDGSTTDRSTPVQVLTAVGGPPMTGVSQVSAGEDHTVIIKRDGSLWAVGNNQYGQLFTGTTENKLIPVEITVE